MDAGEFLSELNDAYDKSQVQMRQLEELLRQSSVLSQVPGRTRGKLQDELEEASDDDDAPALAAKPAHAQVREVDVSRSKSFTTPRSERRASVLRCAFEVRARSSGKGKKSAFAAFSKPNRGLGPL